MELGHTPCLDVSDSCALPNWPKASPWEIKLVTAHFNLARNSGWAIYNSHKVQ